MEGFFGGVGPLKLMVAHDHVVATVATMVILLLHGIDCAVRTYNEKLEKW